MKVSLSWPPRFWPESASTLIVLAENALIRGEAIGYFPTPLEHLVKANGLRYEELDQSLEKFFLDLETNSFTLGCSPLNKLRGIADLRDKTIVIKDDKPERKLFVTGHELGHQLIPWHRLYPDAQGDVYQDDESNLGYGVKIIFEKEANFFASELLFQGRSFIQKASDLQISFDTVFKLAYECGASKQATLWHYVQSSHQALFSVCYSPNFKQSDEFGIPVLTKPITLFSQEFINACNASIEIPGKLNSLHEWALARQQLSPCYGEIELACGSGTRKFRWESWWNTYSLLVLLCPCR